MADIAVLILKVIGEVVTMVEEIESVGEQADRLVSRLRSIEEPVRAVEEKNDNSLALSEVLSIVHDAHDFLSEYFKAGRFTQARKRKSYAETFADLSGRYEDATGHRTDTAGKSHDVYMIRQPEFPPERFRDPEKESCCVKQCSLNPSGDWSYSNTK